MNRIILIGNGFDLSHGLKTSYRDFMDNYWKGVAQKIANNLFTSYEDEFTKFERISGPESLSKAVNATSFNIDNAKGYIYKDALGRGIIPESQKALGTVDSYNKLKQIIADINKKSDLQFSLSFKNQFFQGISEQTCLKSWLGIENEYYKQLKGALENNNISTEKLNDEFSQVKNHLKQYLKEICKQEISKNKSIEGIINSLIKLNDIAISEEELYLDDIGFMVSKLPNGMCSGEIEEEMKNHPEYSIMNTKKEAYRAMIKDMLINGKLDNYRHPYRILFLNFNYTHTVEKLYAKSPGNEDCEFIHIHGELDNPDNPVIFGYGDEMDEHYKKLINLNDNSFLQNIKSIRYLETDNYRQLLTFIDSDPYQIYIMGHSCGNSDRTLLNTLFEHKNCLSIKPFYYQEDSKDNYIDIIQNISRNFKDAALMRDRVVNKTYCEPLPQKSETEEPEN